MFTIFNKILYWFFQVKIDTSKLSGADDLITSSHLKQTSENDYCSVCSWLRSELELKIFINKWQNGEHLKEKQKQKNCNYFSFKIPSFCHLLIKIFSSSSDQSHEAYWTIIIFTFLFQMSSSAYFDLEKPV